MKSFIINGKEYKVNFGHNALCALEEKLGKSIAEITGEDFSARQVQALFWTGLMAYNRGITYEKAGDLIDMVDDYTGFFSELVNEFAKSLERRFNTTATVEAEESDKKK